MSSLAITTTLKKIRQLDKRIRIIQGGSSAGKTYAILMLLIDYAQRNPRSLTTVICGTFPHLRKGAMKDFIDILKNLDDYEEEEWNRTNFVYTFRRYGGGQVEFMSMDTDGKARGPRRDVLYVNEANTINAEIFDQLLLRTRDFAIIDYNPVRKFWAHTDYLEKSRDDTDFLLVTYKDNEACPPSAIQAIERYKETNLNRWKVYGLGEVGEVEGLVYTGWLPINNIPKDATLRRYGLDFGFSNDPTAMVAIYEDKHGLILDERIYQLGILPSQYAGMVNSSMNDNLATIVCDSARPELIAEMSRAGLPAIPCDKGAGSRTAGISKVQDEKIRYTKRSTNIEREFLAYSWRKRLSSGEQLDEPEDGNDHMMDAIRYAISDLRKPQIEYGGIR